MTAWPEGTDGEPRSPIARLRDKELVDERVRLLERAPLFSVLDPRDLSELARKFYALSVRRNEMIFREGEPAERLFLIEAGKVKLTVSSPAGSELVVAVVGRGQIFGELAVIDRGPRAMSSRAMTDSRLYSLGSDVFWTILENQPAFARRLLELMARRLRRADQASQDLVFFDAPTRLARKLLELAEEHGSPTGRGNEVRLTLQVTQAEMAQMIGVTRGSVNRLIASFCDRGLLDWHDGQPVLLSPEGLMRRAR